MPVAKVELRYVQAFADRHHRLRHYFRRPGFQRVALPGLPGSAEFMAAYELALGGVIAPKRQIGIERTVAGTLNALIVAYYTSADFRGLAASTQRARRNLMEGLRTRHGHRVVAELRAQHVRKLMDAKADTPEAANNLRKALRTLMRYAVDRGWRDDDPTVGVRKIRNRSAGFHSWTDEEIAAFEARWPVGTRERLAFALLLYTAQRRSDVVTLGRQHVRGELISVVPLKTAGTSGVRVDVPIHHALRAAIGGGEGNLTFLVTAYGAPFSAAGFGGWFAKAVRAASLPSACTPHGLRKAAGRRLAEAGATTHEIMAVLGHTTLKEAELYTAAANRKQLAGAGMARLPARYDT